MLAAFSSLLKKRCDQKPLVLFRVWPRRHRLVTLDASPAGRARTMISHFLSSEDRDYDKEATQCNNAKGQTMAIPGHTIWKGRF